MTEIGVHRLAARHYEHERANRDEDAMGFCLLQKGESVSRVEGVQDFGMQLNMPKTQHGEDKEPNDQHRTEDTSYASGSFVLYSKQKSENDNRNRGDCALEHRRGDLQAFDGRQDADGWRDDAIPEQEPCSEHETGQLQKQGSIRSRLCICAEGGKGRTHPLRRRRPHAG